MQNLRIFLILFCWCSLLSAQEYPFNGTILDEADQSPIFAANILVKNSSKGAFTDDQGNFSLKLPEGSYTLQISLIGYETKDINIQIPQDKSITLGLKQTSESLNEVVIRQSAAKEKVRSPQMSVNTLQAKDIKEIPTVLGESDVIKSLLLLPGVSNGGEGAGGFNVRGGAGDQNLVLLDNATLYNDSHLFGFFSVFNPDAVQSLTLYKGGIPARFGGRASSVLDIKQQTGNITDFHANGGIGVVSSRLLLEGPIQNNKSSFLVAGRASYAHLFLKLTDNPNSAYFYDLNGKFNFLLDDNNSLRFSGYFGRDVFNINESFKNAYGNGVASLQWNHVFSDALTSDLFVDFSDYTFGLTIDFVGFNWNSGIQSYGLTYQLDHQLSKSIKLNYGTDFRYYTFNPGFIQPSREDSGISERQLTQKYAWENAYFIDAEHEVNDRLSLSYGLRLNNFFRLGQNEVNRYENNQPLLYDENLKIYQKAPIQSTEKIARSNITKSFTNLEPRLSASYLLDETSSVKASYQRINQYLHLISNTDAPTPLDIWAPSGEYIDPQQADQYAIGYIKNFNKEKYTLETEVYYKHIENRLDYIPGADLIANNAIEQVLLPGTSRAYGWEVMFKKNEGKFTGWISYTLSKTEQQTTGRTTEEIGINNGEWYNNGWDKPHDLSITAQYKWSDKWRFSSNFVYQTGRPVTYPNGQYFFNGYRVPSYGQRNENRLPDFHHLDLSATYTPTTSKNKAWSGEWVFSIYNVYNRKNAASINFAENEDTGVTEATRLSIFGIIPSVTYNFKF